MCELKISVFIGLIVALGRLRICGSNSDGARREGAALKSRRRLAIASDQPGALISTWPVRVAPENSDDTRGFVASNRMCLRPSRWGGAFIQ